jgi:3-oxoacyl-[acyl-carrier protein] reductase
MDFNIDDKSAIVAASSKGLGKACAMRLAKEGTNVALCARSSGPLEDAASEIRNATNADVITVQTDLRNAHAVEDFVSKAKAEFGQIDIMVANAGGPPIGQFEKFDDDDWQAAFELNLLSSVRLARETIPAMADRGWGRVVFITSISVKEPLDDLVLSNSVRAGVEGLAKTLSNDYAEDGVTVNCALPGYTRTERLEDLPEEELEQYIEEIPTGRLGEPQEFANLVAFLASDHSSYITGTSIQVDGGFVGSLF